jgi:predicted DNA-binding ribbon-helix-helix protein
MKSPVVKRSIIIGGHKTSVSLEDPFWTDLKEIAHSQQVTLSKLIAKIDDTRQQGGSPIRAGPCPYAWES